MTVHSASDVARQTAFLVALAEHGFAPDIGEFLIQGDPTRGVPPGGLAKALRAAILSEREGEGRDGE